MTGKRSDFLPPVVQRRDDPPPAGVVHWAPIVRDPVTGDMVRTWALDRYTLTAMDNMDVLKLLASRGFDLTQPIRNERQATGEVIVRQVVTPEMADALQAREWREPVTRVHKADIVPEVAP